MVSLRQIYSAIDSLSVHGGEKEAVLEQIGCAIDALEDAQKSMDTLQVSTRGCVDTLFGCMLSAEQIVGGKDNG